MTRIECSRMQLLLACPGNQCQIGLSTIGKNLMRKTAAISLSAYAISILILTPSLAEECTCPGKVLAQYRGGDAAKIKWDFSASLAHEGKESQPLICYRRSVANQSDEAILNIRWDVASYRRRVLPSRFTNDSCSTLPGELSTSPATGPLNYGISSEAYDTTVRPPRDGWTARTAEKHRAREWLESCSTSEEGILIQEGCTLPWSQVCRRRTL
jgi:hypothetical protein